MTPLVRVLPKREAAGSAAAGETDPHLKEEWLVTNGLGGYASGTVSGSITRRYHGLLVAALPNPLGRTMMLNGLSERLRLPDRRVVYTGAEELADAPPENILPLAEFRLEWGLPVWRYEVDGSFWKSGWCCSTVRTPYTLLTACSPGKASCVSGSARPSTSGRTMPR